MTKSLPIKVGMSSVKYSYNKNIFFLEGWILPEVLQETMLITYRNCELNNEQQKYLSRKDVLSNYPQYKATAPGWKVRVTLQNVDQEMCSHVTITIKDKDGSTLLSKNHEIQFLDEKTNYDKIKDLIVSKPYICVTGSIEARKNHFFLYYVWKMLTKELKEQTPRLVIMGSKGYLGEEVISMIESDPEVKDNISILTGINDEFKNEVVDNSLFSIFPSSYEGWGLPVAESIARGKPSLSSNQTSMTEIAPELVQYFNPFDTKECAVEISKRIKDLSIISYDESRIINTYRNTSWIDTTDQILNFFEEKI
jgi:glycosyltransferase involved in cell wall biosynthesis